MSENDQQQQGEKRELSEADKQFMALADSFIKLANTSAENTSPANVGVAMLYAATRYNAFVVASNAKDGEAYAEDRVQAAEYYNMQHEKMFTENLDENLKFFDGSLKYAHLMK